MKKLIILFCLMMSLSLIANGEKGDIKVIVSNLKNNDGKVMMALCKTKKEFQSKGKPKVGILAEINNEEAEATFENIEYGEYAIIIFHDENNNDKMDFKLFIPKEGYGTSNNNVSKMGPPNFKKALFKHGSELLEMGIELVYIGK